MTFEMTPSLLHHPPFGVSCGILLLFAFPFIALAILRKWPFLPVIFFYTPFFCSLAIAVYLVVMPVCDALLYLGHFPFAMFRWTFAEALAIVAMGAASSFVTALFNLRVRRRAMYPVFPITLALTVAAWLGMHAMLDRM